MLSVVIPCHNEARVLPLLAIRLRAVLDGLKEPYEVVLVDDGSRDETREVMLAVQAQWPAVVLRFLTGNVGHQAALTAGLELCRGTSVVTMDADLQDPPELIPQMIHRAAETGADVVYAARSDRTVDSAFKRRTAGVYYRFIRRAAHVDVPQDVGDFRLMSRRVVDALNALPERHRVYRLLIPWLNFPAETVEYVREARAAGTSNYGIARMILLAVDSLTAFTTAPLRLAVSLGLLSAVLGVLGATASALAWASGHTVPGWTSLSIVVLLFGSVQLVAMGVLGEYVGRIYQQVQGRPLYTVDRDVRSHEPIGRRRTPKG